MLYGAAVAIPAARLDHARESQLAHRSIEHAATLSHQIALQLVPFDRGAIAKVRQAHPLATSAARKANAF
jgi:hypothetical protein